ncbi:MULTISPECIES: acireductone synthase [Methylomonas]|uniref:Enolase-phosphatase E1 n=2 Tax=Methylomonas TaxID=416 RepID=A0A126T3Z2_9GAMM|nr:MULTISPECIES: acireductone synthase [Methylomonas]AMK76788.1 haloacid dehalogenase [Methylomonas denitrificans]OAH96362.1 2,3-diketo-5-methylthio-1-phosphopentane phosphatase [Methylomonas methanica]TCV75225.1 acireductone synthase [Methylomonas methanica]
MIKAIVTDIEGTSSSLSFVKDVLFPYARARLPDFIKSHQDHTEVQHLLVAANQLAGGNLDEKTLIAQFIHWIDTDQKITPLKSLQGLIWQEGYCNGDFTGHVYEDAVRNLRHWFDQGYKLYVYSSGSVQAQKLLFGHSDFGDLTPLFSGYFDTHIGGKKEAISYERIAAELGLPAEQILFLSDIKDELDAARQAGLATCWLVREQAPDAAAAHVQVSDFDGIHL